MSGVNNPQAEVIAGDENLWHVRRVGVLSGSFNPLTVAHGALADAARAQLSLDAVLWTCAVVTIDKERVVRATLVDRLCQLSAFVAAADRDAALIVNRGLYADQARLVKSALCPAADVYIVVGFDKVVQIFDPHYYQDREASLAELFAAARLLVAPRDGHGREDLAALLAQPENAPYAEWVTYVDVPTGFAVDSSSEARRLAASSPARLAELRSLLTPEGEALVELRPYEAARRGRVDVYAWRARWEHVLAVRPDDAPLPHMSDIVAATARATPAAADLRRRLKAPAADIAMSDLTALIQRR